MIKKWIKKPFNEAIVNQLQADLKIHPTLCQLLAQRDITTYQEAKDFFRPQLTALHDPFLMKDMDRAIDRLNYAQKRDEKLMIYGDYDVDGTTAVALVYSFLKNHFNHIEYYIPDRYKEGYGISMQSIDYAAENGFSLIIALDCGVTALEQVKYAKSKNVDYIICDHHLPQEELPVAHAVLDPKRADCNYPFKELSGCGVGFKLIQAYCINKEISEEKAFQYLDLLAISIACDIVSITGENRILSFYGLKILNDQPRKGLEIILEASGIKNIDHETGEVTYKKIDLTDVVFKIGPKINAAGRIGDAKDAVRMMISDDHELGEEFGNILLGRNEKRLDLDTKTTEEVLNILDTDPIYKNRKSTVLYGENWHKGVIGIVASRVIEKHYKPTILLTLSNGLATGSARSVRGFDVHSAINACADLLENFGGHKYAAGLSLKPENVPAFIERFEYTVQTTITEDQLTPEVEIDAEIDLDLVNDKFFHLLQQMGPFGPDNRRPVFLTKDLRDNGKTRTVGEIHLKVGVQDPITKNAIGGIAFGMGDRFSEVCSANKLHLCYSISENEWKGKKQLQIDVKDLKCN